MSDEFEFDQTASKPRGYREALFQAKLHRAKFLLIRYWWIILVGASLGLGVQAMRTLQEEPKYISTSRMMVTGRLQLPEGSMYNEELSNFFGTQTSLMKSAETRNRARARVLALSPGVTPDDQIFLDAAQEQKTSLFSLQAISTNPKYAPLFLDAVMEEYLAIKKERRSQTTEVTLSVITQELKRLEKELQDGEEELQEFQKENNVVFIQEQSSNAGNYLSQLNNQMAQLRSEAELLKLMDAEQALSVLPPGTSEKTKEATAKSQSDALERGLSAMAGTESNSAFLKARQEIQLLKAEREDLSRFLKPKHPKLLRITEEITRQERMVEIFKQQTAEQLLTRRSGLELQMENLAQRIKEWEAKSLDLSQRLAEYQRLKSKLARQQMTFDNLSSSVQRVDLNKNMEQENVAVLEHATSASIIRVQLPRQLGLGIVIGALLGCGIIFLLNRLDDRMDSVVELQENFDVPIRGQIPRATINRQTDRVPLLMAKDNRHVFSESYRNIRSSLLFMGAGTKKPRSIVVTSAVPGEGKSTVAANLAITFAFSEAKTLLVDSDMRRGVLHDLFQIPSAPGLADYLQQEGNWRKSVRSTSIPTLSILPRGKVPANPGELLLGPPCDLFLREVVEEYEVVIIDSAPLLATDDTSSLAPKMDGVLFVSRARYSSIRSMRSALDLLTQRHVNLLGIIFNSVDPNLPGYYDYYRYKQYYAAVEET